MNLGNLIRVVRIFRPYNQTHTNIEKPILVLIDAESLAKVAYTKIRTARIEAVTNNRVKLR
jgi:hypothetical protein